MMCVPDPGQCARDRDSNRKTRKHTHNQHRIVIVPVMAENQNHFENQPTEAGGRASRVDPSEMLQSGCTAKSEPQRRPLATNQCHKYMR